MDLLEREECLAQLLRRFGAVATGGGCIALIGGEAGIGKTALLQEFARSKGPVRVLWGGCDALFTPQPLAPLQDIARQAKGALLGALQSGAGRDEIFMATLDELDRPGTLAVFEDMHWADEATLDLLKYLGRRIQRTRSMIAVTFRDDEVGPRHPLRFVLGDLPRSHTLRLRLDPLSEAAVATLARAAGRPPQDLHRTTGGNPLFVAEVLAAPAGAVPATVRDALLARAAKLPARALRLAELTSIVPGRAEGWLLAQALDADAADVEDCLTMGMIRHADGALSFRHELSRHAFEDSLPPPRVAALHAMVLAVLAARPGVAAARLAHHARGACDVGRVLRYAPDAAQQAAAVGAHREALAHAQTAVDHAAALVPEARAELLEALSFECYLTGEQERALQSRLAALQIWRSTGVRRREGDALRWLARISWAAGLSEPADRYADDAIATLEALAPGPELALAYGVRASLCMESHETDATIAWANRAIALAEQLHDEEIVCHVLNPLGTARLIAGDPSGWADLERALELALAGGLQVDSARSYTSLAAMAVSRRDYPQAARYLAAGLKYCEERDLDPWWLYLLAYRARLHFEQGQWDAAGNDAEAVVRHPGSTPVTRIPALRIIGHLRIRRGDPDAGSPLEEARAIGGSSPELQRRGTLAAIHAEAAWIAGDHDGVVRWARPVMDVLERQRDPRMKGELAAWLYRAHALEGLPNDVAEPYAAEIAGDWRGAAAAWQALGCRYEQASVLALYGAEPELRAALATFEELGAAPAAQLLRQKMRAGGVRGVPRGNRAATRGHPHGLTQREAQILELIAEGLRNTAIAKRLFLSTKTVDNHVSSILAKLGVSSRVQAVTLTRPGAGTGA